MEIVKENATSLAWIGDAIMSLGVREHLLNLGFQKANVLQKKSSIICSAKGQAQILSWLKEEHFFLEDEETILARGRNATIHSKAKNASHQVYLQATALEACIGYLYLYKHTSRLDALMSRIIELGDKL